MKYRYDKLTKLGYRSLPARGAWIEIVLNEECTRIGVRPYYNDLTMLCVEYR